MVRALGWQAGRRDQRIAGQYRRFRRQPPSAPVAGVPECPGAAAAEAYISGVDKLFDDHGNIANESTRGFLNKYLTTFAAWVERNAPR
jgi:hypothetical protein